MTANLEWLQLSLAPGLGLSGYWRLVQSFRTPSEVLRASRKELLQVAGIQERQIRGLFDRSGLLKCAEEECDRLIKFGGALLSYGDPGYPQLLKELPDPPPVLFFLGDPELLLQPTVAMVGSRAATSYGRRIAYDLAKGLSAQGLTVVSGLALGIDTEAHKGALTGAGKTIGVLGCGLDVVYPSQNRSLYRQLIDHGVLITEYPLGTKPDGFRFPARNRIIAGISQGVVVVEAAKKSGSLITAQIGLDYGREVFAVPGQVDSFKSEGAHWLLQQGAKLVQRVEDIAVELSLQFVRDDKSDQRGEHNFDIDPDAVALLEFIEPYPQVRETLIVKSGLCPSRVSELLLFLELEGFVEMLPGDKLRKVESRSVLG
ncbi:MAG: DNA-processing protein DprA [Desulforhopalus sp.]